MWGDSRQNSYQNASRSTAERMTGPTGEQWGEMAAEGEVVAPNCLDYEAGGFPERAEAIVDQKVIAGRMVLVQGSKTKRLGASREAKQRAEVCLGEFPSVFLWLSCLMEPEVATAAVCFCFAEFPAVFLWLSRLMLS